MLAVSTASNVGVLAAQDLSFRQALVSDIRHGCVLYQTDDSIIRFDFNIRKYFLNLKRIYKTIPFPLDGSIAEYTDIHP